MSPREATLTRCDDQWNVKFDGEAFGTITDGSDGPFRVGGEPRPFPTLGAALDNLEERFIRVKRARAAAEVGGSE